MRDKQQQRARTLRRAAERACARDARRGRGTLAILTTSALALIPGLAEQAAAQSAENGWSLQYGYSMYSEGSVPASKVSAGSRDRYDIDTHQFKLAVPIGSHISLGFDVGYEKMTGASPWLIEPDLAGKPMVVMTGASIADARTDFLGSVSFIGEKSRTSLTGGASIEDDYTSINFGFGREKDFNQKATTFSWGVGFSTDESDPESTSFTPTPSKHTKKSGTFSFGLAQVIDRASVAQTSLTLQYADGYLSDPYKLVSAGGVNLKDHRPGTRTQIAWLTRYRRHFERVRGSLHADYQFNWDTWGTIANGIELGWHQELFELFELAPSIRYYTQSDADFYAPYFAAGLSADQSASSDYRLSPYGAIAFKLRADVDVSSLVKLPHARIGMQYEHYQSGKEFALGKVGTENPALVDFDVMMVTLMTGF
ncbi:MAG TPA: DUF3570 domain-containing protein [Myxococcota bacterium]|jgi:hypothetical protein